MINKSSYPELWISSFCFHRCVNVMGAFSDDATLLNTLRVPKCHVISLLLFRD